MVQTFESVAKILKCGIHMKATEQSGDFPLMLFVMADAVQGGPKF